jgi:acyl carrier protein
MDVRMHVISALAQIAPEVDATTIDPHADLLDEYDLDSMDLLTLVTILSEDLGVDVPERDYAVLRTLDGAAAYLQARLSDDAT